MGMKKDLYPHGSRELEGGGKKRDLKYDLEGGWFRVVAAEATPVGGAAPASPAAEEAEARRSDDDA